MTRVLVIDDSELVREAATLALQLAGWETAQAPDGEAGLQAAAGDPPDGVLLDIEMPGLDGLETLRRLQADPRTAGVPVAFLTARGDEPGERAALLEAGADGVIAKPFALPELADAVRAAFGWPA
jgi:two-component system phosphate regulon response regulator PhoB